MLKLFAFAQSWAMDAADAYESLKQREEGQTMAEYGVVLAVICALTVGAFTLLRGGITGAIQSVLDALPG